MAYACTNRMHCLTFLAGSSTDQVFQYFHIYKTKQHLATNSFLNTGVVHVYREMAALCTV